MRFDVGRKEKLSILIKYEWQLIFWFFVCKNKTIMPSYCELWLMVRKKKESLRRYCTSYPKLAYFVLYLTIIFPFLKNNLCILYKIVQGTQKWQWNFSKPSGLKVMNQKSQNDIWINNSRTVWPTYILMLFEFFGQFTLNCLYYLSKKCW